MYPGTFDPITNGHLDVIERARAHFPHLLVAVSTQPGKSPLFPLEERVRLVKEICRDFANVEIVEFDGLLVEEARRRGVGVLVKGLRAVSDYEYELQMAQMNRRLTGVETMFMVASPEWSYLSSSLIKEVARLGGDVEGLVPPEVARALQERTRGES